MKTYLRLAIAIAMAMATVAVMTMLDACESETSIGIGNTNAGKDTNDVAYRRVTTKTGRIWLDRNLGASQVAASPSDEASYGNYFQWGRPADGHQRSDSPNIGSVRANTISPSSNNRFITIDANTADWVRSGVDDNGTRREAFLQKTDGTGICPQGYRVPTVAEWRAELDASSQDMSNSTLKLPLAGFRDGRTGKVNRTTSSTNNPNAVGYYLASDSSSQKLVKFLFLDQNRRGKIETKGRAYGYSVRCIEAQNREKAPGAAPSDDHSNSKDEATPINPNSITPGSIETAGDVDWFKIVIPSRGTLVVKTTGTIDTAGELYDASGRHRIAYDDDGGADRNFKITQTVTAGTYYVEVRHRASGTGIYALSTIFTSTPAPASTPTTPVSDDYGNTASTARTISPTSIISGSIETAGDVDWFKVVIPRRGTLVATLSSPTDIDVSLYNVSNIHIASEDSSGSSISQSITAGTYYVKVRHHSSTGTGIYALSTRFTPAPAPATPVPDDYGNTKNTAATISPTSTTSGNIGTAGDEDWFKVVIPRRGTLVATLSSPTDINISLYNASNTYMTSEDSSGSGSRSLSISRSVTAGTYYVKVRHHSSTGTGVYALSTSFTPAPAPATPVSDDYGNTRNTAATIGTTSTTLGDIETAGDVDYFEINIPSAGTLVVNTTGSTDTAGYLYNASGTQIGYDNNSGTGTNFKISQQLEAGTYYVKVSASSSGNYALVSQVITDDYGNTRNTAATIGTTSTTSGDIETAGDVDYFEINIPSAGTLVATLSSPTDINISLYNAGGTYITSEDSSGSGSRSLSISQSVTAGTYYVKVKHYSSTGMGIYALSTRFTASIPVSDDYGNTKNTAATIGTTSTTLGSIETARDVDWFKVIITSAGTLVVETTGSTDTNGVLYNASGAQIVTDNNSGTGTNFKISQQLEAGTYYVKVSASSSGNYALVSQVITDDYGNTRNTAATIGTTSTTSGDIETAGDVDYFEINIPSAGTLVATLSSPTDINISLYNAGGTYITSEDSSGSGSRSLSISQSVTAGTYYVKVRHHSSTGTGIYALSTRFTPAPAPATPVPDDYGNTRNTAATIGTTSTTSGSIEVAGDVDYFEMNIPSAGTLVATLSSPTDINISLYNAGGTYITSEDSSGSGSRSLSISQSVTAGTYYVKVKHYSSTGTGIYALSTRFTPAPTPATPVPDDYGNTKNTAATISPTSTTSGNIGTAGDEDWFKVVTPSAGTLVATLSSPTDINISLYNASNMYMTSEDSSGSGSRSLSISRSVTAGTYYVKVRHHSSTGTGVYALSTSFTPAPAPATPVSDDYGNTRNTAATIGTTSTTLGDIETAGDVDYFEINITSAGTLVVNTTGSTDTAGYLYNASGTQIGYDDNSGTGTNFKISQQLEAGTYYVKVSASSSGNYALVSQVITDDYGNTRNTAATIGTTSTTSGDIETAGDVDYFEINIPSAGTLVATLSSPTDINISLYNAGGTYITSEDSSGSGSRSLSISQSVTAGTYYVKVKHYSSTGMGIYALSTRFTASIPVSDDYGNTKNTAATIGTTSTTLGSIETARDVDWFKVIITSAGTLVVETTGSTDTNGVLYNASGAQIVTDNNSGTGTNFKISQQLEAGTYYVKVSASSSGNYALVSQVITDDYGNTRNTAATIGTTSTTSGDIETAGDVDYFEINIPSAGTLVATLSSPTDINISLYNAGGTYITSEDSSGSGSRSLSISQSVTAGTYYVKVRHHSSTGTGIYALSTRFTPAPAPATPVPDDYGNTRNTAATIGTTSTTSGSIEVAGDVDYFEMNITSAGTLTVNTTGSTDTVGILYNASGAQIGYDDDSGTDNNFKISKKVVAGTYYVRVSASSSGNYGLVYHVTADDHGDTKETATSINPDSNTSGSIETARDVDWFKVIITSAGTLVVETTGSIDTVGELYDVSGRRQIGYDNNSGTGTNFKISQYLETGTYYIKVAHRSTSGTGSYTLTSQFTPDDYGDDRSTATSITSTSTTSGRIDGSRDVDYFEMNITSAGTLVVETTGSTDTVGILYNASGAQIGYDDDSGTDNNFKISKKVVAGTYYVRVSASSSGNYGLVYHVTADDHGDTKETATSINPDSNTSGSIETARDVDWFKVIITSAGTLVVETTGSTDTVGELYDVSGRRQIGYDNNSGTGTNFKISQYLETGTYYIKVAHRSTSGTGSYVLSTIFTSGSTSGGTSGSTTSGASSDDHNNTQDGATPINLNSTTAGDIETAGDEDWFKVVIPSAGTLVVNTTGSTDTYGYLLDANNREIESNDDGGLDRNFKISKFITTAGTYYVRVKHHSTSLTGSYSLVSQFIADDYGNARNTAATISATSTTSGNLEIAGDVDYFKIVIPSSATRKGALTVDINDTRTYTFLRDTSDRQLASFHGLEGNVMRPVRAGETYYVSVEGSSAAPTVRYTLTSQFTPDDHGDTKETATLINPDSNTSGHITSYEDKDYFKIVIPRAGTLVVETTGATDTKGTLSNNNGRGINYDSDSGIGGKNFKITQTVTAGTYYVIVQHQSFRSSIDYYSLITQFTPDP